MITKMMALVCVVCVAGSTWAGLLTHYEFEGNWNDSEGPHHLTPFTSNPSGSDPVFGPSAPGLGQAAFFDGENGAEVFDTTGLPNAASNSWTISSWLFVDEDPTKFIDPFQLFAGGWGEYLEFFPGGAVPGSKRNPFAYVGARVLTTSFEGGTQPDPVTGDPISATLTTTTPLRIGEWQMLTFTYDGSTGRYYMSTGPQGGPGVANLIGEQRMVLADVDAQFTNEFERSYPIFIAPDGPWDWGAQHDYIGGVDDFRIYDHALSVQEINDIYLANVVAETGPDVSSIQVGEGTVLTFQSVSNQDYVVQCSTDGVTWVSFDYTLHGTGGTMYGSDPTGNDFPTQNMYRVIEW